MTINDAVNKWMPVVAMGVEDMPEIKEAVKMAIASLEAWEKVRQDIDESRDALKTMIDGEWFAGKLKGLDCAVAIINKHLQEVTG